MIGIVDYNAGNITSVKRALDFIGVKSVLSKNPSDLEDASRIVFPGVGDASYAMAQLKRSGFDLFLKDWAKNGKPLLGICLGSQIIFDYSEEGGVQCLGLIPGRIRHLKAVFSEKNVFVSSAFSEHFLKIPHIGWNSLAFQNGSSYLLNHIHENSDFYFVHSYVICPDDEKVIKATADYGVKIPACVESGSVTAFQFHPEKSGVCGLQILRNFCCENDETSGERICKCSAEVTNA